MLSEKMGILLISLIIFVLRGDDSLTIQRSYLLFFSSFAECLTFQSYNRYYWFSSVSSTLFLSLKDWLLHHGCRVADPIAEVLKGIRCYFDKALLPMLLYKKERQQYHEVVTDNISPSTIYGAEHLLRLFGILSYCI